jgi:hypothetical protein
VISALRHFLTGEFTGNGDDLAETENIKDIIDFPRVQLSVVS